MASRDRRTSSDQIDPNNRVEGDQSDDEASSCDQESLLSRATTPSTAALSDEDNHRRHAGPSAGGSSIDGSNSGSTLTLRRGSNPENLLPTVGRSQPGDEPERREEAPQPIDRQPRHPQVRFDEGQNKLHEIEYVPPPPQPQRSKNEMDRSTKLCLYAGGLIVLFFVLIYVYLHYDD
uniref:Uncharacterized protein n=1 Tax=Trichogramma kaykai TaxID=54128 RepID=A0ABD2WSN5_9HYME